MPNPVGWQDIAVVFRYDRDWLLRWLRGGRMQRRYNVYMIVLAILTVNFLLVIPTAQEKGMPTLFTVLCLGLLGYVFFRARAQRKGTTAIDALYNGGREYRAFFRADGFSFKSDGRADTVGYDEKVEVTEKDGCFLISYREKERFVLPKEALSDEQTALLSRFWSERLEKRYHYAA